MNLLTVNQAAKLLGVSRQTLYHYLKRGLITSRLYQWDDSPEELKRLIRRRRASLRLIALEDLEELINMDDIIDIVPPYLTIEQASQEFNISIAALRAAIIRNQLKTKFISYDDALMLLKNHNNYTLRNIRIRGLMVTNQEAVKHYVMSRKRKR